MKPTPLVVPAATPKPTVLAKGGASLEAWGAGDCPATDVLTAVLAGGETVSACVTVTGAELSGMAVVLDVVELGETVEGGTAAAPLGDDAGDGAGDDAGDG